MHNSRWQGPGVPRARLFLLLALSLSLASVLPHSVVGGDYNIRLLTDSTPDLTDIESYTRSICNHLESPQEKAIAIWRWGRRNRHQTSCAWDRGRLIWDPVLHFNSYGYMNCGIISALNIAVARPAGFQGRYIQLGDHTVSELSWNGGATWHLFDSSMSIFCRNHEGAVASCEEIKGAAACDLSSGKKEVGHFYCYHPAAACASHLGPTGWRYASDQPVEYERTLKNGASSYTSGYSVSRYSRMAQWGRRYVLNLKPFQEYTRHWKMLGADPGYYRAARGEKSPQDIEGNDISRALRANGVWEFRPDLSSPGWREFVHDHENLQVRSESPHFLPRRSREPCRVVFKVDAANVITSMQIDATLRCPGEDGYTRILVSRDAGLAWKKVWEARGEGRQSPSIRLVEEVAGHTEALVRFDFETSGPADSCGLESLSIRTVTQVNRLTLPRLHRGENRVRLRLGRPVETLVLWPVLHAGGYRETAAEERGIYCRDETDSFYKATLGAGIDGSPCHVTWRLPAPTDILELTFGARVCNRMATSHVSLQYSWDGKIFQELFRKDDGSAPFDRMVLESLAPPPGVRTAWVKCEFLTDRAASTYNTPGIQDLFFRLLHRPRVSTFRPLEVTFCWMEYGRDGRVERRHTRLVETPDEEWLIRVGGSRDPAMNWVRLRLQEPRAGDGREASRLPRATSDGSAPPRSRRIYHWARNVAQGAPYTTSHRACNANGDDAGRELTNGIVIAPTERFTSNWPTLLPISTAGWDGDVTIDVDLGKVQKIAGAQICTHQPNARYCHPLRVEVLLSDDGSHWRPAGKVHHNDLWDPPGDYEPWEYDKDPKYEHLPAGGRLAYRFPLTWIRTTARHVRFRLTAREGRGIGISELQVFDDVEVSAAPRECTWEFLDR